MSQVTHSSTASILNFSKIYNRYIPSTLYTVPVTLYAAIYEKKMTVLYFFVIHTISLTNFIKIYL